MSLVCNVALNRPSHQSSVYQELYGPNLANDGSWNNVVGQASDPKCAHSGLDTNPWWAVDLGIPLSIAEIFFRNRLHATYGKYSVGP